MYFSRITVPVGAFAPQQLFQLARAGEYVFHQWLWELFPYQQQRDFIYRREERRGALRFYLLSHSQPVAEHPLLQVECKPFTPHLEAGMQLGFSLRANPVICRQGKKHDLLMHTKHRLRNAVKPEEIWAHQERAAQEWLVSQGAQAGFTLLPGAVSVMSYQQQQVVRPKSRSLVQFSTVDFSGVLTVDDPARFTEQWAKGFGKSRAFGCGLMLIKPAEGQA
ncbi:type I-E CRISPR-associated protein Cas6/Cse3/CasE [Chimaeribacter californicus]|uniref:Type I-E CRISPR-associated protein Cas6/Cse3/CasE n=1 Tax=Chimaeribacter californicus TaxID=2060067 RepID=A0A2N5E5Z2_9GAMM|nr:type I-E CRISPR-associated protein Cas6/Cse3/CasE [Chimaeribacter californicus]PLR36725.1 type I-E CRISPR-associated protein Cas6/Cse3/CasE [Chimaeribacter californicus]